MDVLDKLAIVLRRNRRLVGLITVVGMSLTSYLIAFSSSAAGFALAGPLVITPWAMLCIGLASQPSRLALVGSLLFGLAGLAWPLLYI